MTGALPEKHVTYEEQIKQATARNETQAKRPRNPGGEQLCQTE